MMERGTAHPTSASRLEATADTAANAEGRERRIEQLIIDIISQHLGVRRDEVTLSTRLVEDLGADSLDVVELIMELEEEFRITIPDDRAEKLRTVGNCVEYVAQHIR